MATTIRRLAASFFYLMMALVVCATVSLSSAGPAQAGMDSEKTSKLRSGQTMTVQLWDTFLNGVAPVDRNRLTREWFHSGRATYQITGDGAENFSGTLEIGYEIGFPWSLGVGVNFEYTTPNLFAWEAPVEQGWVSLITPYLFPGATISSDLGNGPGVQEVATFSVPVSGPVGTVAVANAHGTVTGAAGGVLLRPFARLIWPERGVISTYGPHWNMN